MSTNISYILKLSIPERILLVEAIWDSIVKENDKNNGYQLSDEEIGFLEDEIEAYRKNPEEGSTWEEIKSRVKNKK